MSEEDENLAKSKGFESVAEVRKLIKRLDLSSAAKRAALLTWQQNDGSKSGLLALPTKRPPKHKKPKPVDPNAPLFKDGDVVRIKPHPLSPKWVKTAKFEIVGVCKPAVAESPWTTLAGRQYYVRLVIPPGSNVVMPVKISLVPEVNLELAEN